MRILFLALAVLCLLPAMAQAAPFIYCDSYAAPAVIPTSFKVSLDGGAEVSAIPWTGTSSDGTAYTNTVHYDVGNVSVGNHVAAIKACAGDPLWGTEACSTASPFSFSKPAPPGTAPSVPTGGTLKR